ncbi:MAG: imidazole glycerol phosphate synthase subunit HisH [Candidatus Aminicenantes bacterium]|nr:imidazole glycerol phosphate synthase subunit HisH [Candidatus Aminicenantes bacterium]
MIGVIDYGAGNLHSVRKSLDRLGLRSRLVSSPCELAGVRGVVLPGVGHFGAAAGELERRGLTAALKEWLAADRPFLGICLGMQLLFEDSEESDGRAPGLGAFRGNVVRLQGPRRLHMGWSFVRSGALREGAGARGPDDWDFSGYYYFVHGYVAVPAEPGVVAAVAEYRRSFAAVVRRGNVLGVQFHPEKSGALGLRLLERWGKP